MVLSGDQIRDLKKRGRISITPILDDEQFEGAKVDLRLDNTFDRIVEEESTHHDTRSEAYDHLENFTIPFVDANSQCGNETEGKFILHPNEFALAQTFEYVDLPNDIIGILGGRSSLGRHGIVVHATASVIDPGYAGNITLELTNFGNVPVVLYPRQRVASIVFDRLDEGTEPYSGRFGGSESTAPEPSEDDGSDMDDSLLGVRV